MPTFTLAVLSQITIKDVAGQRLFLLSKWTEKYFIIKTHFLYLELHIPRRHRSLFFCPKDQLPCDHWPHGFGIQRLTCHIESVRLGLAVLIGDVDEGPLGQLKGAGGQVVASTISPQHLLAGLHRSVKHILHSIVKISNTVVTVLNVKLL